MTKGSSFLTLVLSVALSLATVFEVAAQGVGGGIDKVSISLRQLTFPESDGG